MAVDYRYRLMGGVVTADIVRVSFGSLHALYRIVTTTSWSSLSLFSFSFSFLATIVQCSQNLMLDTHVYYSNDSLPPQTMRDSHSQHQRKR